MEEKLKEKAAEKKERESQTTMEDTAEGVLQIPEKDVEKKKNDILDIGKTNIDLTEMTKEMRVIDFSLVDVSDTTYLGTQNYSSNEIGSSVLGTRMDLIG